VTEIGFYHLTRTALEHALPALLGRTLAAGERAVVMCGSPERVAALDRLLWDCKEPAWLPHGSARTGPGQAAPSLQPIWLTADDERPNGARFLFLLDRRTAPLDGWGRVFDLFDGQNPDDLAAARQRWSAARAAGHALTYWKQTERGWVKD